MTGYVVGYDATRVNAGSMPRGAQVYAGYSSGTGEVPWPNSLFAAYATPLGPCLRIDQDPSASDPTADYLDVENGAATIGDCPGWAKRAMADFKAVKRRGQRTPAIYMSASAVTPVANALVGGGVKSGVGLVIANWSITEAQAIRDVLDAAGPFPVVGYQIADPGPYDIDIYSRDWLLSQAGGGPAPVHPELAEGATGQAVKTLQAALNKRGARPALTVDGVFGPDTKSALQAYQVTQHLTADGICGKLTWARLG